MTRFRFILILATTIAGMLLVLSCSGRAQQANQPPGSRLWFVANTQTILDTLPPAIPTPSVPITPIAAQIESWKLPPMRWLALERQLVAREWLAPTRAARSYALLGGGMSDVLAVTTAARERGTEASDDTALATFAERVVAYNHPALSDLVHQHAEQARWVGVWQGRDSLQSVATGERIGRAVADQVIAWAQNDGADRFVEFTPPAAAPGIWRPTPPRLWSALDPGWGSVRPIVIPSGASMDAAPPPAWDSPAFVNDRAVFAQHQQNLSEADKALAKKWAGGMGTMTPAGLWLEIADQLVIRDNLTLREAADVYATLSVTMHDSFIADWHSKYTYLVERPVSWMRESNPTWLPDIQTPPFPSYPSGHATVSGAASTILAAFFPHDQIQLEAWANDAAYSRIVGGIHWPLDSQAGLAQGKQISAWVLTHPSTAVSHAH